LSLFLSFALLSAAAALSCYEDDAMGVTHLRSNPQWKYCSLIPYGGENGRGRLMGVSAAQEDLSGLNAIFGQNSDLYAVKVMCLQESHNVGALSSIFKEPEVQFRCFCAHDK
ncbi:hypothetical protein PMAYCL1PPCAC_28743, partial [Pristionchus mayeri]